MYMTIYHQFLYKCDKFHGAWYFKTTKFNDCDLQHICVIIIWKDLKHCVYIYKISLIMNLKKAQLYYYIKLLFQIFIKFEF